MVGRDKIDYDIYCEYCIHNIVNLSESVFLDIWESQCERTKPTGYHNETI